uniref:Maspardin n=1 Tax=Musa acuminata subsp. malaccensis TaxID=214687 RepID=A0A804K6J2_MUSAM|nr:PREDICTED: maspardin-like isoform X2 [Musa acuminata subsp. malaccensis]
MSPAPGDYVYFKSQVPLHKIFIENKQWRYYDFGPKTVPPLICIPGIAGTTDVYYKQIMSLSMKGYRVISVDVPHVWSHHEWAHAFEKFLDTLSIYHVHLYGTSLGGFLALVFAQHRPRRVKSLVLSNAFLETHKFAASMPWSSVVNWTPSFLLKRYILSGIRDGPHEPFIADSVDFVVAQVETLTREDLSSRLKLNVNVASVGPLLLSDSFITIMDTNDYCAIPQQLKDQVSERFPGASQAILKTGGDFPFLSRSDEVNLYLQPDKVQDSLEDGGGDDTSNYDNPSGHGESGATDDPQQPEPMGPSGASNGNLQPEYTGPSDHSLNASFLRRETGSMKVLDSLIHYRASFIYRHIVAVQHCKSIKI